MIVVIADDNRTQRDQLMAALATLPGLEVHQFKDGAPALEAIRKLKPDFVILDVIMNGMTGAQVVQQLRAEGNSVPVIMATSMNQIGVMGNIDYQAKIIKPFMPDLILEKVMEVIDAIEK